MIWLLMLRGSIYEKLLKNFKHKLGYNCLIILLTIQIQHLGNLEDDLKWMLCFLCIVYSLFTKRGRQN